jgi:hypothetical protein
VVKATERLRLSLEACDVNDICINEQLVLDWLPEVDEFLVVDDVIIAV